LILDLHVAGPKHGRFCTGQFHVHPDNEFHGIMTLHADFCHHCGSTVLDAEQWVDILGHEITELTAVSIAVVEEHKKWNAHGYNKAIAWAIPLGVVDHTCRCGCEYTIKYAR
jgi:hypothetical protein